MSLKTAAQSTEFPLAASASLCSPQSPICVGSILRLLNDYVPQPSRNIISETGCYYQRTHSSSGHLINRIPERGEGLQLFDGLLVFQFCFVPSSSVKFRVGCKVRWGNASGD
jgi:hypothetical protein